MREILSLAPTLAVGAVLGAIFCGGLWWTVVRGVSSPQPALWFFSSLVLRTGTTLVGFYFVGGDDWRRWLLCLLGFVIARGIIQLLIRASGTSPTSSVPETRYAP